MPPRLAAATLALLLGACTPDYNWREIRVGPPGYLVMLPGKPTEMTRTIRLGEIDVAMTMRGAQVRDTAFTVAEAPLPAADDASRNRALSAMRTAMVRNIAGAETQATAVQVQVVDPSGRATAAVPGIRIEVEGTANRKPVSMVALFVGRGDRVYQAVSVGPDMNRDEVSTFVGSLRLLP